jgi:hypothetical protein
LAHAVRLLKVGQGFVVEVVLKARRTVATIVVYVRIGTGQYGNRRRAEWSSARRAMRELECARWCDQEGEQPHSRHHVDCRSMSVLQDVPVIRVHIHQISEERDPGA